MYYVYDNSSKKNLAYYSHHHCYIFYRKCPVKFTWTIKPILSDVTINYERNIAAFSKARTENNIKDKIIPDQYLHEYVHRIDITQKVNSGHFRECARE